MKKPLPTFLKDKMSMHTMPNGKKMKDSAMKKTSKYASGGFTSSADGVAKQGKTKAQRFDMGGMTPAALTPMQPKTPAQQAAAMTPAKYEAMTADQRAQWSASRTKFKDVVPSVNTNTPVGPPPSRIYQSEPGGNPMVQRGSPRMDRNDFRAARDAKEAARDAERDVRKTARDAERDAERRAERDADRDDKMDKPKRMMAPGMTGAPVTPKMGMGMSPERMAAIQAKRAAANPSIGKLPAQLEAIQARRAAANPPSFTGAPVKPKVAAYQQKKAETDSAIRAMYSANPTATKYNPNGPDAAAMKYWRGKINTSGLDAVKNGMFGQAVTDYADANPMKGSPGMTGKIMSMLSGSSNPTTSSPVFGSKPLTTGTGPGFATGPTTSTLPPGIRDPATFTPAERERIRVQNSVMKKGGAVKPKAYASGGCVSSKPVKSMARGGGCEIKGKTKGRYI